MKPQGALTVLAFVTRAFAVVGCGDAGSAATDRREDARASSPPVDARQAMRDADARVTLMDARVDATRDAVVEVSSDAPSEVAAFVDAPYPAFAFAVPQVVNQGGAILADARFVPVVFPGETLAQPIQTFVSAIGGSPYWSSIGAEYGVGPATAAPLITETTPPGSNTTDPDIQSFLAHAIATDARFAVFTGDAGIDAAPPTNIVYVLFYPPGTTITATSLGTSCVDFGGYHSSFVLPDGPSVTYVVLPRCPSFHGLTGIDEVTGIASHELIEAATDPDMNARGFVGTDLGHIVWELATGDGEVADMCSVGPSAYLHPPEAALSAFVVQRVWSNLAASAGEDPCRPLPLAEGTYFNAQPETAPVPFTASGQSYQTLGTQIPLGQTATVYVDLASQGPTEGPWSVSVLDYGAAYGGPTVLDLRLIAPTAGTNGDRLELEITPLMTASASLYGLSPYFVYSTRGAVSTTWIGAVSN